MKKLLFDIGAMKTYIIHAVEDNATPTEVDMLLDMLISAGLGINVNGYDECRDTLEIYSVDTVTTDRIIDLSIQYLENIYQLLTDKVDRRTNAITFQVIGHDLHVRYASLQQNSMADLLFDENNLDDSYVPEKLRNALKVIQNARTP